jgi:uncharacterized protein YuzE
LKIKYSQETDILVVEFKDGVPVDSVDMKEGVILHLDSEGFPLEIEILDASKFVAMDEFNILVPMIKDKKIPAQA